jgi:CARDB
MRRLNFMHPKLAALFACLVLFVIAGTEATEASEQPAFADLQIDVSESEVSTLVGESFTFTSTIANNGSQTSPSLIVNLAFVSVDHSTYVDPEDWSSHRTMSVQPIAAGATVTQTWSINTVLQGEVAAYVVVLPDEKQPAGSGDLIASAPVYMHVTERRTLNPGGVLPVVLIVPGLIALTFTGMQFSRRSHYFGRGR